MPSYFKNEIAYGEIETTVAQHLGSLLKKQGCSVLAVEIEFYQDIWTFVIFKELCGSNSSLDTTNQSGVIPLITLTEVIAVEVEKQSYIAHYYACSLPQPDLNALKVITARLLLALTTQTTFCEICSQEYTTVVKTSWAKVFEEATRPNKPYTKTLIFKHTLTLVFNPGLIFGLLPQAPKLIQTKERAFLISQFPPFAQTTIVQRHNRPASIATLEFYRSLEALASVPFYPDSHLLHIQEQLIDLHELQLAAQLKLLVGEETPSFENILNELRKLISMLSQRMQINTAIALTTRDKIQTHFTAIEKLNRNQQLRLLHETQMSKKIDTKNLSANTPLSFEKIYYRRKVKKTTANSTFDFTLELTKLANRWTYLVTNNKRAQHVTQQLQQLFSRFHQYNLFRLFKSWIHQRALDKYYFFCYADFRGRFYYASIASPQAIWCYRQIYTYPIQNSVSAAPVSINDLYFTAIGVLFKKEITDSDGSILLIKLANLGKAKFERYTLYTLAELLQELKEPADVSELYYYLCAIRNSNPTKGFYIWKDTTCSIAQHAGKLLGYNTANLHLLNLNNTTRAYDTYTLYINELKKQLKTLNWTDEQLSYLTRKLLKQVIMTIPYGVTQYTAYKRHQTLVYELYPTNTPAWLLTHDIFKQIFEEIKNSACESILYQRTKQNWLENQNFLIDFQLPDFQMSNLYFYASIKSINLELPGSTTTDRKRHQLALYLNYSTNADAYLTKLRVDNYQAAIDQRSTMAGLYVNQIHAYDAYYMRNLVLQAALRQVPIVAVHDGFAIPPYAISWLISTANTVFNKPYAPLALSHSILL